jgi:hypothetical protein
MTTKEKSEELVNQYRMILINEDTNCGNEILCSIIAIKSALIAVDEILKANELNYLFTQEEINCLESTSDDRWIYETYMKYWQEVKHEIKKL